jgi:hypothetical protein
MVRSEQEDGRSEEPLRWSALPGLHRRNGEAIREAVHQASHRDGHQHARATRVIVNVQAVLFRITRAIVRRIVVMVMPVVIMMVMAVMMMVAMAMMMNMVPVAVRVGMNEKARERSDRRPVGSRDDRRKGKRQGHHPHRGNAASACSPQLRQHASCHFSAVPGPPFEGTAER